MTHRVVIVDDVAELRQILRLILQHSGQFQVVGEGRSGEEAVQLAAELHPDLLVLDVEMPGGPTGWQVLPRIREVAPETRTVIYSGSMADESEPGKAQLAAAVIEKGLAPQDLIRLLLEVVGGEERAGSSGGLPMTSSPEPKLSDATTYGLDRMSAEELAARLVALVVPATDAIIGKSLTGEILLWNPAAERMYGYSPEEAIGRSIAMLVPPDRPDEVPEILDRIAAGERVEQFETVRVHRDGTLLDVALTISPVLRPDGTVLGAYTIACDISGRRESDAALSWAVAQLERRNRELRRSNQELDNFAAVASHDLAQPLQVAYGYLEMTRMEFGASLDPTAVSWLDAAAASLERMRGLVHDILGFARMGSGEFVAQPVSLTEAAAVATEALAAMIESRDAAVQVDALPVVPGNQAQLAQLLQNLIANALKFAPEGVVPSVRISADRPDGEDAVIVNVDDNGEGVPVAQRERIFDLYQRAHGSEVSGTGLGLATCRKIVARHGGRIWVEDAPGGGARFRFLLPATSSGNGGTEFGNASGLT